MTAAPVSVLLVEDDLVDQMAFKSLVASGRLVCSYSIAGSVAQGRRLLNDQVFDVIVADHQLPDGNAFDLLEGLSVFPVVILATGVGDEETAVRALRAGLSDYLIKDPERHYLRALPARIERAQRQRQVQLDLEASEARLRDLFENTTDLIYSTAPDGQIEFVNRAWHSTLGYCVEQVKQLNLLQILHPEHHSDYLQMMERLHAGERIGLCALTVIAQDGRAVELEGNISARIENGQVVSTQGIFRDVTESKRNANRLRALTEDLERLVEERTGALVESQARFTLMAETIEQVFWMKNAGSNAFVYASPAFKSIWQKPLQALYHDASVWTAAIHPQDRDRVVQAVNNAGPQKYDVEFRIVRPDGTVRWIHEHGYRINDEHGLPLHLVGTATDTTERKSMEQQMLRAQRIESIGTLAGGIAHDLNNALAPILMGLNLLRGLNPEEVQLIDTMEASGLRGANMVKQLLTFARGVPGDKTVLQSRELFAEIERFVLHTFPKNIRFEVACSEPFEPILGDATQLHQVLLNLCLNARDAMPSGGALSLTAQSMVMDAQEASGTVGAMPGRYVMWRVSDSGGGMPRELLEHIFDPFFTTKTPGKGTGLGLSTVLGIVRSHKGFIQVDSTEGVGTVFRVYLPVADTTEQAAIGPATMPPSAQLDGHGQLILVVDDEQDVRAMASAVLQSMNFRVVTAIDGVEALALLSSKAADVGLVITDLHMPRMDGLALVKQLKDFNPTLPVLVCSGQLDPQHTRAFSAHGVTHFLHKPFTQKELTEKLGCALPKCRVPGEQVVP